MKILGMSTLLLTFLGLLFVFEASLTEGLQLFNDPYHFAKLHLLWLGVGYLVLFFAQFFPTKYWQKIAGVCYVVSLILLLLVFVPGIGKEFNGAHRWIAIGTLTVLQPIEIAKFSLI